MRTTSKKKHEHILQVLWDEFTGEKRFLLIHQLWWDGVITRKEYEEAFFFLHESNLRGSDSYYFTLACFFLLYLDQEF